MVCVPVRSIIPSLKLGDYLSVQAHKPCSISHMSDALEAYDGKVNIGGRNITNLRLTDDALAE